MTTTRFIGTLVALGTLGMAVAAGPGQKVKLEGKGAFTANGRGIATIDGSGTFSIEGAGQLLIIAGPKDKIEISGFGNERIEGNKHFYSGAGKVSVTGNKISIKLDGKIDSARAIGKGSAKLYGKGDYSCGKLSGHWLAGGGTIWFVK